MISDSSRRCAGETGSGITCSEASSQLPGHQKVAVTINGNNNFNPRGQASIPPRGICTN